jgi:hypothetical protein
VYRGVEGYPWWGSTYNIALEPCVSLPTLHRAVERGEALRLAPGESLDIQLAATAFEGIDRVGAVEGDGHVISR